MYHIKLASVELKKLNQKRQTEKNKEISNRLNCIYLAHAGKGNKEITQILSVNKNSVTNWVKIYLKQGIAGLCRPENFDRRSSRIDRHIAAIKQDARDHSFTTLAELANWLNDKYALRLEASWLFRCCKKNSIYLTRKHV